MGYGFSEPIRKEFNKAIDYLFDQKLYPFVEHLNYLVQEQIKQSKDTVEAFIAEAIAKIQALIDQVFSRAEEIANKFTPEKFREELFKPILSEIKALEEQFFQDAYNLLKETEKAIAGEIEVFKATLNSFKHAPPNPTDPCRNQLNLGWKSGLYFSDIEIYRLMECYELRKLDENTPIPKIREVYAQLQHNAARMAYLAKNSPALHDIALQDWVKYGQLYQFWYQFN